MFKKRKLQSLLAAAMVVLLAACGGGGGGGGASGGVPNGGGSGNSGIDASSDAKGWGGSGSVAGGGSANGGGGSSAGGGAASGGAAGASSGVSVTVGSGGGGSTTYSDGINDLNWSTMNFKVFVNGNLVFDQPISKGDQISMKGVKVGDKIHAEGSFLVAGEDTPRTVSGDIPSATGNDKLTLYVGYKCALPKLNPADGTPTGEYEEVIYNALTPPPLSDITLYDGQTVIGWKDSSGNLIAAGRTGDLASGAVEPVLSGDPLFSVSTSGGAVAITDITAKGIEALSGKGGVLTIPEGITEISAQAFDADSHSGLDAALKQVKIPDTVTAIGNYAFSGCTNLAGSVNLGSVENVGQYAFSGTNISGSVDLSNAAMIDTSAFQATQITSVTTGSASIQRAAFTNCQNLTSVTVNGGTIGDGAFQSCSRLSSVTISEGVTGIGLGAFNGCTALTSVSIPSTVISIDTSAFEDSGLTSVTIAEGVSSIGQFAFMRTPLRSVTLPESCTSIGGNAFQYCDSLESINIPKDVASIGNSAFYGCTSLKEVTIDNVSGIQANTFDGCSLETVIIGDSVTSMPPSDIFDGVKNITLGSNCNATITDYTLKDNCKGTLESITIGKGTIGSFAFMDFASLREVSIGTGVTEIGAYAFAGCTSLSSVRFEDTATWVVKNTLDSANVVASATSNATKLKDSTDDWYNNGLEKQP